MIRWGIIGCGAVTEVKSGPALQKAERSSVIACMRRDGAKAQDYADRHKIARAYDDAADLIRDKQVDAVYIATPPDSHADLAIKVLEAGKPVLVETPVALSSAECDEMARAAKLTRQSLVTAYYRRALPRFEKLRALVQDGTLGIPCGVSVRHLTTDKTASTQGGGVFAGVQTHTLDWLGYLFGSAVSVSGIAREPAPDRAGLCIAYTIGFDDVVVGGLSANAVGETEESVTIYGTEGSASLGFFRPSPVIVHGRGAKTVYDLPDPPHTHLPFIERTLAHLLEGASNPCPLEAARRSVKLAEQLCG